MGVVPALRGRGHHVRLPGRRPRREKHDWPHALRVGPREPDGGRTHESLLVPGQVQRLPRGEEGHLPQAIVILLH